MARGSRARSLAPVKTHSPSSFPSQFPLYSQFLSFNTSNSHSVLSDSAAPWTVARQAPLSMGFSGQEYRSGEPFPSPGDLPDPEFEYVSPACSALQADSLPSEPLGKTTSHPVGDAYPYAFLGRESSFPYLKEEGSH